MPVFIIKQLVEKVQNDNDTFALQNYLSDPQIYLFVFHLVSSQCIGLQQQMLQFIGDCCIALRKQVNIRINQSTQLDLQNLAGKILKYGYDQQYNKLKYFINNRQISLNQWLKLRFNRLIKGKGQQFFVKRVQGWRDQLLTAQKSVRRAICNMMGQTIFDIIVKKQLQNKQNSFDIKLAQNAGVYRLLQFLQDLSNMLGNQVLKNANTFQQYFLLWINLVQKSNWIGRWMCNNQLLFNYLNLLLGSQSPCSWRYSIPNKFFQPNFDKLMQLICIILKKSDLCVKIDPLYIMTTAQKKLLTCNQLLQKAFGKGEQLLDLIIQIICVGNQQFSQRVSQSLLNDLNKINHSDYMKVAMRNLRKFFKVKDNLNRNRCQWVLGFPRLKSLQKTQFGFGLYTLNSIQQKHISYHSTLGHSHTCVLQHLLKNYKKTNHMSLVMIWHLIALMNQCQQAFLYIIQMPAHQHTYSKLIDFFQQYMQQYYDQVRKPNYINNYQDNVNHAFQQWKNLQIKYQFHLQSKRVQLLLKGTQLKSYQFTKTTMDYTYIRPLILGKVTQIRQISSVSIGEDSWIKEMQMLTHYIQSIPGDNTNKAIPDSCLKSKLKFTISKKSVQNQSVSTFFINPQKARISEFGPQEQLLNVQKDWIVRQFLLKNSCTRKLNVCIRFQFKQTQSQVLLPKSKIHITLPANSSMIFLTLFKLPQWSWPQYSWKVQDLQRQQEQQQFHDECFSQESEETQIIMI